MATLLLLHNEECEMRPSELPFWRHEAEPMQPAKRVDSAAAHQEETLVSIFRKLVSRLRQSVVATFIAAENRNA
jgi:hypothetical protein